MLYRRGQIDSALYAVLSGPFRTARRRVGLPIPKPFQTRITRLLEIDRAWGIENQHRLGEFGMAFHDALPTGTGTDIEYSEFNAFSVAVALEMLKIGFKQGEVAETIGLLRTSLQKTFARSIAVVETDGMLRHTNNEAGKLPTYKRSISGRDQEASLDAYIFLVLNQVEISPDLSARTKGILKPNEAVIDHNLCRGWDELMRFLQREIPRERPTVLVIELSELAARLMEVLPLQPVRRRGRQ